MRGKLGQSYEVFYPSDHEFIHEELLPSFYHNGPSDGYRVTQVKMSNKVLGMRTYDCDFCTAINDNGNLGTLRSLAVGLVLGRSGPQQFNAKLYDAYDMTHIV